MMYSLGMKKKNIDKWNHKCPKKQGKCEEWISWDFSKPSHCVMCTFWILYMWRCHSDLCIRVDFTPHHFIFSCGNFWEHTAICTRLFCCTAASIFVSLSSVGMVALDITMIMVATGFPLVCAMENVLYNTEQRVERIFKIFHFLI